MNYNEANKQLIDLNIKLGELNTQLENYDFDFNLLNHKDDIERGRAEHKARKMFEFHKVIEEKTAERGNLIRSLLPENREFKREETPNGDDSKPIEKTPEQGEPLGE